MNPFQVLKEGVRQVPAVRYATAVAGVVAVVAIIASFRLDWRIALIGGLAVLVFMVAMVVFAGLTKLGPAIMLVPSTCLLWAFLILTVASAYLFASSVFFDNPLPLSKWITGDIQKTKGQSLKKSATIFVAAYQILRSKNLMTASSALPEGFLATRSSFENDWFATAFQERLKIGDELVWSALDANTRTYRYQEESSDSKPLSQKWCDETVRFFEEAGNSKLLLEALLSKAALYLDFSDRTHTDPEEFLKIAEQGNQIMSRAESIATADKQSEVLRLWSRFHYNLARPRSGNLSEPWNNDYLRSAFNKITNALALNPLEFKNVTQYARTVHKYAKNPPQDEDPAWTEQMRLALNAVCEGFKSQDSRGFLKAARSRLPGLNIIANLTFEVIAREIKAGLISEQQLTDIDKGIGCQQEVLDLVKITELRSEYRFDIPYDLARGYAVKSLLLTKLSKPGSENAFSRTVEYLKESAKPPTTKIQVDAALQSLTNDICFFGINAVQLDELKKCF